MTCTVEPAATPTDDAAPVDWSRVRPDAVPPYVVDAHPRLVALRAERDRLLADVARLHAALGRVANVASAVHSVIEPLEDTLVVANSRLSPEARALLFTPAEHRPPPSAPATAPPAPSAAGGQ